MKKVLILVGISILLLVLDFFGGLNWLKGGLSLAMGWRSNFYSLLIDKHEPGISQELADCRAEVIGLREENEQARRLLEANLKPETKIDLGKIISLGSNEVIIFLEDAQKIEKGTSVVSGPFLVGKVNKIYKNNLKANLLVSPEIKVPVKIWPSQSIENGDDNLIGEGILTSDGQYLYVKEILDSYQIEKGNWIGAIVESGDLFWIGKIEEIFPTEDKVFQEVRISWGVDLSKLMTLGIVK